MIANVFKKKKDFSLEMQLLKLFCVFILQELGGAFETIEGHRVKRQSSASDSGFNKISWLQYIVTDDRYVKIPGMPKTPTESHPSKFHELAFGKEDEPFQPCTTPRFEKGHCRYIQHCVLDDFANNFKVFLKYACFIQGVYVGVCCRDSLYSEQPITTRPSTTQRPTQPTDSRRCGVSNKQQAQVVGGKPTQVNAYPWAAALLREKKHHCGGSLLNTKYVLTAAHCIDGFDENTIIVRLGEYSYDQTDESHSKDYSIAGVKLHEKYIKKTFENDVALVTLDKPVNDITIWPICLPPPRKSFADTMATVIGWGDTEYDGELSRTLLEVTIPVWKKSECVEAYRGIGIFDVNICAGDKDGGKGTCQGDSGGPLMYQENNQWMVIGVVSWGIRCAEPGLPGVYARVTEFLSWINENSRI